MLVLLRDLSLAKIALAESSLSVLANGFGYRGAVVLISTPEWKKIMASSEYITQTQCPPPFCLDY
jgi:hypothetical protein